MDDIENNMISDDKPESSNNLFPLYQFNIATIQGKIEAFTPSQKYIFLLTDRAEIYRIEMSNENSFRQAYSLPNVTERLKNIKSTRIWTDKIGNFALIKVDNTYYLFYNEKVHLLEKISEKNNQNKGYDIVEVAFDRRALKEENSTNEILLADRDYNLYSYKISINKNQIIEILTDLITLPSTKDKTDRIFGLDFIGHNRQNTPPCYVVITTKNKLYQFTGEGTLIDVFKDNKDMKKIQSECTKCFPISGKNFPYSKMQLTFNEKNNHPQSFGWMTESGFCYGNFDHNKEVPDKLKNFIVLPYVKIKKDGTKDVDLIPKSFVQTKNHIFILYPDCITVISKITSNIIDTQPLVNEDFKNMYLDESKKCIWVQTDYSLYQISLNDENKDIWQDYLEVGEFNNAFNCCKENPSLNKQELKINRLWAYDYFEKEDYLNASVKYSESDEKFEEVCLKFLLKSKYEELKLYLEAIFTRALTTDQERIEKEKMKIYDPKKMKKPKNTTQKFLVSTWLVEIYLNENYKNNQKKNRLESFRQLIREKEEFLDKDTIYQLLQNYGRIEEFIEFAELKQDYETVILHYINEKDINKALQKLQNYTIYLGDDEEVMKKLAEIFVNYAYLFMKQLPKESIELLTKSFKKIIPPEKIVTAIMNTTENKEGGGNFTEILKYLRDLIKEDVQDKNIHNLYLYYLSRCSDLEQKNELINYLKIPLVKETEYRRMGKKKEVKIELDYAKKLLKENYPALALVLALMGKYSEGVKIALVNNYPDIAMFIAQNVDDDKIKKNLWLDIFSSNKKDDFKNALDIMEKSQVLKIEDVLPRIMDNIKIEEFKEQISNCIDLYEKNIKTLRDDITQYNKTAEDIKTDIYKVKKKSLEIQYRQCKCDICQCNIKDNNIYLFPCGHMFDAKCIISSIYNYKKNIIDNNEISNRVSQIEQYNRIIGEFEEKKKNISSENKSKSGIFGAFINVIGSTKNKNETSESNKLDEEKIADTKKKLSDVLSEECVLCGDYMVDSTQCPFVRDEKIEWDLEKN